MVIASKETKGKLAHAQESSGLGRCSHSTAPFFFRYLASLWKLISFRAETEITHIPFMKLSLFLPIVTPERAAMTQPASTEKGRGAEQLSKDARQSSRKYVLFIAYLSI